MRNQLKLLLTTSETSAFVCSGLGGSPAQEQMRIRVARRKIVIIVKHKMTGSTETRHSGEDTARFTTNA